MAEKETAKGGHSTSKRRSTTSTSKNKKSSTTEQKRSTSRSSARKPAPKRATGNAPNTSKSKSGTQTTPKNSRSQKANSAPNKSKSTTTNRRSTAAKKTPAARQQKKRPARQRPAIPRPDIARWQKTLKQAGQHATKFIKTLTDPAFWRRIAQKLPPWTDELGAILLIVMGVVLLTALLNTTSEAVLSVQLSKIARQIFGGGAHFVALGVLATGIILLLPKFGKHFEPGWARTAALEVAFGSFTALLHLLANDPEPRALAREGSGGGYLGWALSQLTISFVGTRISIIVYGILLLAGLIYATKLRREHLALSLAWARSELQERLQELESRARRDSFPPEGIGEPLPDVQPDADLNRANSLSNRQRTLRNDGNVTEPLNRRPSIVKRDPPSNSSPDAALNDHPPVQPQGRMQAPPATVDEKPAPNNGSGGGSSTNNDQNVADDDPALRPKPLTREELIELAQETRRILGSTNGRSLVSPGEPGERESVVPREYLPDARVVSAAPRARARRRQFQHTERYFAVDDFREVKKIGKRDDMLPPLNLLSDVELNKPTEEEINLNARIIKNTLLEFDVETEVIDIKVGPTVTQYAVSPYTESVNDEGETVLNRVRVSQIANLNGDLALALSAKRLRIQAPVPGHAYVGVEVPNRQPSTVALRPVLESETYYKYRKKPLGLPLGRDVSGEAFVTDLQTMPHLLIAGTTGSGKSIMLASMTTAFIMNNSPDQVRLVLLDPKMVELTRFNGIPHLMGPVETELDRIIGVLRWATREMDRRYKLLEKEAARNLELYNQALGRRRKDEHLPYIVIIIDEIGDLMMQRPDETERTLTRLAQMARAVGIHLMVATQRPSVDVITGLIKANFPARISFAVASSTDSRVILDTTGAESLMGRGDMLFLAPDASGPRRIQGCYTSDEEVNAVVNYWRNWWENEEAAESIMPHEVAPWERGMTRREVLAETDPMLEDAISLVIEEGEASASLIQRRLGLGYPRAARIMDHLHELGVVGAARPGGRSRRVLVKPGTDPFKMIIDKRLKNKK